MVEFPLNNFLLSIESSVGDFAMSTSILTANQISHVTIKLRSIGLDTSLFTMATMPIGILFVLVLIPSFGSFTLAFLPAFGPFILDGSAGLRLAYLVDTPTVSCAIKALDFDIRTIGPTDWHKDGNTSFVGGFQSSQSFLKTVAFLNFGSCKYVIER